MPDTELAEVLDGRRHCQLDLFSRPSTPAESTVFATLRARQPCSYSDVQEHCGLPGAVSSNAFAALSERGLVRMLPYNHGEQQLWEVVE